MHLRTVPLQQPTEQMPKQVSTQVAEPTSCQRPFALFSVVEPQAELECEPDPWWKAKHN